MEISELATELFDAFWAAVDQNELHYSTRSPEHVMLLRRPDCDMPPRLWVYMAEMLAASMGE